MTGPWPWQDLSWDEELPHQATLGSPSSVQASQQDQKDWSSYPQNLFRNWSLEQCKNSKISEVSTKHNTTIYVADIDNQGKFYDRKSHNEKETRIWEEMAKLVCIP
jgi:hypothetical protein